MDAEDLKEGGMEGEEEENDVGPSEETLYPNLDGPMRTRVREVYAMIDKEQQGFIE